MGNSRSKVYQKSLASLLLLALEKAVDGYVTFEDFAYNPLLVGRDIKKSALSKALKRLREKGLIQEIRLQDDILIKLTEEGKELLPNKNEEKWDGKWRIVVFDIPEEKRLIRNLFRRNLKKWDFQPLQKSVWVSKRSVFSKLEDYIRELGIGRWVTVIEATRLSS